MVCYINRGIIIEQAIASEIEQYFDALHLDDTYENFHVRVTNNHPFADLYLHTHKTAADHFPAVVVTSESTQKTGELAELKPEIKGIGLDQSDIDAIMGTKEYPGICTLLSDLALEEIKKTIEKKGLIYGLSMRFHKTDSVSIEIWSDNVQLKNELYQQLMLFVSGNLQNILANKYSFNDLWIFDHTISGHPSNNYNLEFGIPLSGAHISMDVDYQVEQLVLDTEVSNLSNEIITEVVNHVRT